MCYEESRWHICNHTVKSRTECPRQCVQYGELDTIEIQLTAYCFSCRRHVDSLGVARRQSTRRVSKYPEQKMCRASTSAVGGTTRAVANRARSDSTSSSSMTGSTSGSETISGREAVAQSKRRPQIVLSPVPRKPQLSLHIPEGLPEAPPAAAATTTTTTTKTPDSEGAGAEESAVPSLVPSSSSSKACPKAISQTSLRSGSPTSPWTPHTPWTPLSLSASLEEPPSKPPNTPLPSLPKSAESSATRSDSPPALPGRAVRKAKSSSWLPAATSKPLPVIPPRAERAPASAPVSDSGSDDGLPLKMSATPVPEIPAVNPLRKVKSLRAFDDDYLDAQEWEITPLRPPPPLSSLMMDRPRPWAKAAMNHFPATGGVNGEKKAIDIHDPEWLAKHGLKWDPYGVKVVSAAV